MCIRDREKIGQLNQYNDDITATGPVTKDADKAGQVRAGKLGSIPVSYTHLDVYKRQLLPLLMVALAIPLLIQEQTLIRFMFLLIKEKNLFLEILLLLFIKLLLCFGQMNLIQMVCQILVIGDMIRAIIMVGEIMN